MKTSKHSLLVLLIILFSSGFVFAQNEKKVAYGILIDNTGSMRSQFEQVLTLSKAVARHVAPKGPVSVFNFTSAGDRQNPLAVVSAGSEWSQDADDLENFIDDLFVLGGQTTLLDAIDKIARDVNAKVNLDKEAFSNGAIIVITDGEDRVSRIKDDHLIKELQKSGTRVFALGLVNELKSKRDKAENLLKKITKETGGRAIFPKPGRLAVDTLLAELFAPLAP